jgi:predicted RNase H-like HicB family nuclease
MRLRLVVAHDSQTKRWAAFFPELPGCASAGDTEDEAIQNAKEALELWFEPAPVDLPPGAKSWKLRSRERALPRFAQPKRSFASCVNVVLRWYATKGAIKNGVIQMAGR